MNIMKMIKAKKRPITVTAFQFNKKEAEKLINHKPRSDDRRDFVTINNVTFRYETYKTDISAVFIIDTLEGPHVVSDKDFILTGINGEHYPCKPDIFDKTYKILGD